MSIFNKFFGSDDNIQDQSPQDKSKASKPEDVKNEKDLEDYVENLVNLEEARSNN